MFRVAGRLLGAGIFDATAAGALRRLLLLRPRARGALARRLQRAVARSRSAAAARSPWLYLGYHVAGSAVMEYKAVFRPHEALGEDGRWR